MAREEKQIPNRIEDTGNHPLQQDALPYVPGPLELGYNESESEEVHQEIKNTAQLMLQLGVSSELEFILRTYPELSQSWVEGNTDVRSLVQEFRGNPRYCALVLNRMGFATFDTLYQAFHRSPIRKYLGDFTVPPPSQTFWAYEPPVRIRVVEPEGIDLTDIRINYHIDQDFTAFSQNSAAYLSQLQTRISTEEKDKMQKVWQGVYGFYKEVNELQFPALVPQLLDEAGNPRRDSYGNEVLFPSPHEKVDAVRAGREGSFGNFNGPGSGKTADAVCTGEYIGAERILVICPAGVRGEWVEKLNQYYRTPPVIYRIDSAKIDLDVLASAKYTILSYDQLARRYANNGDSPDTNELLQTLLQSGFQMLVVDEAHYINNENLRSDAVLSLAREIPFRYPMTATPSRNDIITKNNIRFDDLSHIVHLINPRAFSYPETLRRLGPSGISPLAELLATKTTRKRTEDLVELPFFCPDTNGEIEYIPITLNPTQQAVYDAIFDDASLNSLTKLKLLRRAALDHNLIRKSDYTIPFDENTAIKDLQKAYRGWKKQQEQGESKAFDSDYLVKNGYKHVFLGAHLHYKRGMNQFIQTFAPVEIQAVWSGVRESTKFQQLEDMIRQKIEKGEKVIVSSGHFVEGVIKEMVDDVDGTRIMQDLYSYLQDKFPDIVIQRIFGGISTQAKLGAKSKREQARQQWKNNQDCKILLMSTPTGLGIDLTVNDGVTSGVSLIAIDLPYTYAELEQAYKRVFRFGQPTPVTVHVLEGKETIDEGVHELILKKAETAEQLLDGVSPERLEEQILENTKTETTLKEYIKSPKRDLDKRFYAMRGQGVSANGAYLEQVLEDGRTIGEVMAELYTKYWEYSYSGHTARLVQQVLYGLRNSDPANFNVIADAGSGPLVLDRIMRQELEASENLQIISVDMNSHMLETGVREMQQLGYAVDRNLVINRSMSDTGIPSGSCDAVVCSLAFHYTSSDEDRGTAVAEAGRILRDDGKGYYIITLPEGYLTPEQYLAFGEALRKFGFEIDKDLSGLGQAVDYKDSPFHAWIIIARKVGMPINDTLPLDEFRFTFEEPTISTYKEKKGKRKPETKGEDKLVKHTEFAILDPEDGFINKGSPREIVEYREFDTDEENVIFDATLEAKTKRRQGKWKSRKPI